MPGSQNTSFIPKHTNNKSERKSSPRQLFIGTLIIRVFFFAVIFAAVGVFFYERQVIKQKGAAVDSFQAAVGNYNDEEDKLQEIIKLNDRLNQATNILQNSYSLLPVLAAFEENMLQTAKITSFEFEKTDDQTLVLDLKINTDTFDSVLFQRELFAQSDTLKDFTIKGITINNLAEDNSNLSNKAPSSSGRGEISEGIDVEAIITLIPKDIPVVAFGTINSASPTLVNPPNQTSEASVETSFQDPVTTESTQTNQTTP